jgi:spore coat protein U-like protein
MKYSILTGVAAMAMTSGAALAQDTTPAQLAFNLNAQVSSVCGVYNASGTEIDVDFGELSNTATSAKVEQSAGSASYACNAPDGFTRTISSANGGYLFRDGTSGGANNQIAYEMRHGGGSGLSMDWTQLTSAVNSDHGGSSFLTGQTGGVNFRVDGVRVDTGSNGAPSTNVFAGSYSDVVTITLTAS